MKHKDEPQWSFSAKPLEGKRTFKDRNLKEKKVGQNCVGPVMLTHSLPVALVSEPHHLVAPLLFYKE